MCNHRPPHLLNHIHLLLHRRRLLHPTPSQYHSPPLLPSLNLAPSSQRSSTDSIEPRGARTLELAGLSRQDLPWGTSLPNPYTLEIAKIWTKSHGAISFERWPASYLWMEHCRGQARKARFLAPKHQVDGCVTHDWSFLEPYTPMCHRTCFSADKWSAHCYWTPSLLRRSIQSHRS